MCGWAIALEHAEYLQGLGLEVTPTGLLGGSLSSHTDAILSISKKHIHIQVLHSSM